MRQVGSLCLSLLWLDTTSLDYTLSGESSHGCRRNREDIQFFPSLQVDNSIPHHIGRARTNLAVDSSLQRVWPPHKEGEGGQYCGRELAVLLAQ